MSKLTLLDIVQDILNDLDSDEVNSIDDTVEATQIANIVKTTYEEIISNRQWPHLKTLVQLTASGDSSLPTHMSIGDNVQEVFWVKYNKIKTDETKKKYSEITYKDPLVFIDLLNARSNDESNIDIISDPTGIELLIKTDAPPTYYTSFDDENLVFDSYDSDVDSTLQSSKTQVYILKEPTFSLSDTFVPDLPAKNFPYLLSEAKSVSFNVLRQAPNAKEEQRSRRHRTWSAREKWRIQDGKIQYPNYGRR